MNGPSFNPHGNPYGASDRNSNPSGPAQDEKLMAAAAHASILLPHAGLLMALVLWLANSNSGRSPFVAFQAKQAFFFHLAAVALEWLVVVLGVVFAFSTFGLGWALMVPVLGLTHIVASIYGVIGAMETFQGRDFRYPVIGSSLKP